MGQGTLRLDQRKYIFECILESDELLELLGPRCQRDEENDSFYKGQRWLAEPDKDKELIQNVYALPLRTGSRASPSTLTNLDIPRGAVKIHSCVLSGRALEMCVINCKE